MALKRYDVEVNGVATTLQLSDEDAKLYGLKASDQVKEAKEPANKQAQSPQNKGAQKP